MAETTGYGEIDEGSEKPYAKFLTPEGGVSRWNMRIAVQGYELESQRELSFRDKMREHKRLGGMSEGIRLREGLEGIGVPHFEADLLAAGINPDSEDGEWHRTHSLEDLEQQLDAQVARLHAIGDARRVEDAITNFHARREAGQV